MFTSSLTAKEYHTRSHQNVSCQTSNVIYGLECSLCGLIYVGQTGQKLSKRVANHRSNINRQVRTPIYEHFNSHNHSIVCMKVRIIEKIYHYTNSPILSRKYREDRELFWIKELGTTLPYGCNDNIKGIGNLSNVRQDNVNSLSLLNSQTRRKRSHGKRKNNSKNHVFDFLNMLPIVETKLGPHEIRTKLFALPLKELRKIQEETKNRKICIDYKTPEYKLTSMILSVAKFRLEAQKEVIESEQHKNFLHIEFANKGIDLLNLSNILHHSKVMKKIPPYFNQKKPPSLSYQYTKPIATKIFNYKKVLTNLSSSNIDNMTCNCKNSPFIYKPVNHIVSGDLNMIKNDKLRELIKYGPKFREQNKINWNLNFKLIMDAVEDYARKWAKIEREPIECLSEWIKSIRNIVIARISNYKSKNIHVNRPRIPSLSDTDVRESLAELHQDFVLVPTDKASNNVSIICKKYYLTCISKELGITANRDNNTYTLSHLCEEDIIDANVKALGNFNISVPSEDRTIPLIYWLPKMHKNPYKERFIAGSRHCTTKTISRTLTKILTVIKDGLCRYCNKIYETSNINQMFILKNSKTLLETLQNLQHVKHSSLQTFDFTTLYTTIPHRQLKSKLHDLIHNAFVTKTGKRRYKYIAVNYHTSYFTNNDNNKGQLYTESKICSMLEFLIDNIYVRFGDKIFRQTVGIPMGTNCAPLLADLYLYSYESSFIQQLTNSNQTKLARKFNLTFRYIDDLLSIDNPNFRDYIQYIYPSELELKETTISDSEVSYLDLHLSLLDGNVTSKLYDKRDDFDFEIINFPYLISNIPATPAYGVYTSQLIRYQRACVSYLEFQSRHKSLVKKLIKQGFIASRLINTFKKFYGKYGTQEKYQRPLKEFLRQVF